MTDHDIGKIAAEMLKKRLPGFETRIDGSQDRIAIHGALPIATTVSAETLFFPIYRPVYVDPVARALRDVTETDAERVIREAKEREAIEREIEPAINLLAEHVRKFGIHALGLETYIAERERFALAAGRQQGYDEGRDAGRVEGRRELMAELAGLAMADLAGLAVESGMIREADFDE